MLQARILLVEDEGIVAADIQERLTKFGYEVLAVGSAEEALEKCAQGIPQIVLMDIVLKGMMDGIEAAIEINRRFDIPVVFLTAYADDETIGRAKRAKPFGYIIKPYEERGLHSIIELALDKHHMERIQRKRAAQEREMVEVQLRQAQKLEALGRLAAGILHEITVPTQYIRDNVRFLQLSFDKVVSLLRLYRQLLEAGNSGPENQGIKSRIREVEQEVEVEYLAAEIPAAIAESLEGVARVVKVVQAMKEFSHPSADVKIPVNLNKAIESTLTVARSEWKEVADLAADFDPLLPPVPCFIGEINQVLLNLVVNAAHAIADATGNGSNGKGRITVSTRGEEDWVEFRISDTGRGIPENIRERIFESSFTTKEVGRGTGLGLAIAQSVVVKKHGGTITFQTETGKGTTFIVRLPIHPA